MSGALVDAMIAGAAGSTALNMTTYLDMVARARPASGTPDAAAGRLADAAHVDLGPSEPAANRRAGLGPLLGYGLGVGAAVGFALLTRGRRPPLPVSATVLGLGVMALSDGGMTALGVTDPRRWSRVDWLSDLVPHLVYGVVAAATWNRLRPATPWRG
ncbi:hypothetical protein O7606_05160 [Micromonospora sp. WMMD882]|uniref:hypothetical protein n=1 Tax=Micromonospora sp. WMMD882 TaxID=3015151 RepID=UPI00248CF7B6|nr:hypothetical protein [Micromonospora sp. WMMD882]WBB80781.1 hypothetical protein O7606_05160 [Micromonospora sp. WMMD882]